MIRNPLPSLISNDRRMKVCAKDQITEHWITEDQLPQ